MAELPKIVLNADEADKTTFTDDGVLLEWFNRDGRDYLMHIEDPAFRLMKRAIEDNNGKDIPTAAQYISVTSRDTLYPDFKPKE